MNNEYADLDNFVEQNVAKIFGARAHVSVPGIDTLYVRIAVHCVSGVMTRTLDIASVDVSEANQRRGTFKRLLRHCEELAKHHGLAIYVESVLNEHLARYLARMGYKADSSEISSNYSKSHAYLMLPERELHDSSPRP